MQFPSIYLGLVVIKALKGKHKGNLENNLITVLQYLSTKGQFISTVIYDTANGSRQHLNMRNRRKERIKEMKSYKTKH